MQLLERVFLRMPWQDLEPFPIGAVNATKVGDFYNTLQSKQKAAVFTCSDTISISRVFFASSNRFSQNLTFAVWESIVSRSFCNIAMTIYHITQWLPLTMPD